MIYLQSLSRRENQVLAFGSWIPTKEAILLPPCEDAAPRMLEVDLQAPPLPLTTTLRLLRVVEMHHADHHVVCRVPHMHLEKDLLLEAQER